MHRVLRGIVFLSVGFVSACQPSGGVQVFIKAEDSIPFGIDAGSEDENIIDGWQVRYDKFIVSVGNFRASRSAAPEEQLASSEVHVLDLVRTPSSGVVIATFADVLATRWDRVGYSMRNATPDAQMGEGLASADYALMVNEGWSLWVEGRVEKTGGAQCLPLQPANCAPIDAVHFVWRLRVPTAFDGCASPSGDAGFTVPSGGTVAVKPTLHGDHWFFTNITQGEEITQRRAQWVADVDTNRDGEATLAELGATPASALLTSTLGYNLSGALIPRIDTMADYLEAQARTLGDYQGDGECEERTLLSD